MVSFRNKEDVSDIWAVASKGVLWCDGLKSDSACNAGKKRKAITDNITPQTKKSQDDASGHVQQLVETLKNCRGKIYSIYGVRCQW